MKAGDEERIGERVGKIVEGCGIERRLVFDVVMTPGCRRSEEMIWISLICRSMIERSSRSRSGNVSRRFCNLFRQYMRRPKSLSTERGMVQCQWFGNIMAENIMEMELND